VQRSQASADLAEQVWREAQKLVYHPQEIDLQLQSLRGQLVTAEKNVELAETRLKEAQIQYEEAQRSQNGDAAITAQHIAQQQVAIAEVNIDIAEASRDGIKAQISGLESMRNFPVELIVNTNQAQSAYSLTLASMVVAEANLDAVAAPPRPEDEAVAEAQVAESQASAAKIDVLLDDLILRSPRDGVILERSANVGELAAPGRVLMKLADLDSVDLVVFVPEAQIGLVREGQKAAVKVDAYPDEVFEGTVSYIAPDAEFTPKNVQTKEERVNLVFQVKIRLDNQDRRLKPGMPADAEILDLPQ
jgi:multidrug resistance efflux pump